LSDTIRRWTPAFSMMLVSTISYIDRNTLALLAPTILKETGLSGEQYGTIISAFSFAYMLGNPLWGKLLDRIGVGRGMTLAVSLWTAASAAHAFARGFWSFAVFRAALGFGEGATFPGSLRTVVQTLAPAERSRGIAIAYSGGSLGAILTPIVVTPVAVRWGWTGAFWFTGLVGLAWILWWLALSRRADIARPAALPAGAGEGGGTPSFRERRLWSFICAYALGAMPLGFVLYSASLFLSAKFHKTQVEIGAVLWIPPLGWELGYFFWGWVMDRFTARGARAATFQWLFGGLALLSLPLAAAPHLASYALVLAELFLAMFLTAGFIIGGIAWATRMYSSRHAGFIAGLGAGSWSASVALVMPYFGRLFDQGRYDAAFLIAALLPSLGFLGWRLLRAGEG
jgi:ACS family hexuronate transporter-like MFS transporter